MAASALAKVPRKINDPEIKKAATQCGIDLKKEPHWLWIAESAVTCELPDDWKEFPDDSDPPQTAYYHPKTKQLTTIHPIISKYKKMFDKQRRFMARTGMQSEKVEPRLAMYLNEVLNRCHKELPPVTPEIVEKLALLLNINTAEEFQLARTLKMSLEEFAESQYELQHHTRQRVGAKEFLELMRFEQIKFDVLDKPLDVVMCSEIEGAPAELKCEQCKDFFSLEGFRLTHATGKRRNHNTARVEQTVCSVYPDQHATCEVNHTLFCDKAYIEMASRNPELRMQKKRILGGLKCSEYPDRVAELLCEACSDLYCTEAYIKLHRRGNRRRHVALQLDKDGQLYRAGEILPPQETAKLIDRARLAREGGAWLAFLDDQLTTYWYHLADKIVVRKNPYL